MKVIRDGPRRHEDWPPDMKKVRDSAFEHPPLTFAERLSRRRRYLAESGRYPHLLTTLSCWTVKAVVGDELVGYAWAYLTVVDGDWAYIDDVAVHANHQGQGVGTAIIDGMVTWLHESGVKFITGFAADGRMARIFGKHQITAGVPREGRIEPE